MDDEMDTILILGAVGVLAFLWWRRQQEQAHTVVSWGTIGAGVSLWNPAAGAAVAKWGS